MGFSYFYEQEADMFSFYRIPKLLFTDERFKELSTDAKVLYGLMLDRMSLSMKNKWLDDENRVYIIFTIADVMEEFDCSERKAIELLYRRHIPVIIKNNFDKQHSLNFRSESV